MKSQSMPKPNYGATVDRLGRLKAEIAKLKTKADFQELTLILGGQLKYSGKLFDATVTPDGDTHRLDIKRIRTEMGDDWIMAHTVSGTRSASVKLTARKLPKRPAAKKPRLRVVKGGRHV